MLSNGLGHARLRRVNYPHHLQFNHRIFLDGPAAPRSDPSPPLFQLLPVNQLEKPNNDMGSIAKIPPQIPSRMLFENQLVAIDCSSRWTFQAALTNPTPTQLHFLQQQHSSQMLQLQQQLKFQNENYGRSNSGFNLMFDNSSCTGTASSSRSFLSSLSIDGSMGSMDGKMGGPQLSNPMSWHLHDRRRCSKEGTDGSGKRCMKTGRCHCSKKRSGFV